MIVKKPISEKITLLIIHQAKEPKEVQAAILRDCNVNLIKF